jgi:hypothetical protein
VHVPDERRRKLDAKTVKCTFIGHVADKHAYRCIDRRTGMVYESRDVIFDERDDTDPQQTAVVLEKAVSANVKLDRAQAIMEESDNAPTLLEGEDSDDEDECPSPPAPMSRSSTPESIHTPQPELRRSTRTRTAPIRDDDPRYEITSYGPRREPNSVGGHQARVAAHTIIEPKTYEEAMSTSQAPHWQAACNEELLSFIKTHLYDEVDLPSGRKVVDCKWVFKLKQGPDGEVIRYKA